MCAGSDRECIRWIQCDDPCLWLNREREDLHNGDARSDSEWC